MRIAQNVTFNEGKENPKTLVIKLEQYGDKKKDVYKCYYDNEVVASVTGDLKDKYLKETVQRLQDEYKFDIIDLDVKIEMSLLFGIKY